MEGSQSQLLLKRAVNVKAIVTPLWKEEVQKQLQNQLNQIDNQLQQLEMQGQRVAAELQKQTPQGGEAAVQQQISSVQNQVNQKKSGLLEQKNKILQQLQQVQMLEMDQEVSQGQIESFFRVDKGDNLIKKLQVEILLRDGVIEDIRGEL